MVSTNCYALVIDKRNKNYAYGRDVELPAIGNIDVKPGVRICRMSLDRPVEIPKASRRVSQGKGLTMC